MKREIEYELQMPAPTHPHTVWGIDVSIECENGGEPFTYRKAGLGMEPSEKDIADLISLAAERVKMCGSCSAHCMVNRVSRTRWGWYRMLRDQVIGK